MGVASVVTCKSRKIWKSKIYNKSKLIYMNDLYFHCYCVDFSVNAYEMRMKKVFFSAEIHRLRRNSYNEYLKLPKQTRLGMNLI